jgi:hypothetical protein
MPTKGQETDTLKNESKKYWKCLQQIEDLLNTPERGMETLRVMPKQRWIPSEPTFLSGPLNVFIGVVKMGKKSCQPIGNKESHPEPISQVSSHITGISALSLHELPRF